MTAASIVALGFLLGLRHATDPDHVVAVGTLVSRDSSLRAAARVGALWGLGHSLTVVAFGALLTAFRWAVPPRLGLGLELVVAMMLVLLGLSSLARSRVQRGHTHPAKAGGTPPPKAGGARSLLVGAVHGLAGTAAVALLAAGAMSDTASAAAYLAVFGVGTLVGMTAMTVTFALPFSLAGKKLEALLARVTPVLGAVSVALGLFLAYRIGTSGGFFSASPSWSPN